jgi:hypothetical protein
MVSSVKDIIQIPFQMDLKEYYEDGTLKQKYTINGKKMEFKTYFPNMINKKNQF